MTTSSDIFLTDTDLLIVQPEYDAWIKSGNKGTLQHFIGSVFLVAEPAVDDEFENAKVLNANDSDSDSEFNNAPLISSHKKSKKHAKKREESDSDSDDHSIVIESRVRQQPVSKRFGNLDNVPSLDKLSKPQVKELIKSKPTAAASSSKNTSFLERVRNVKIEDSIPTPKQHHRMVFESPRSSQRIPIRTGVSTKRPTVTFDDQMSKDVKTLETIKNFINVDAPLRSIVSNKEDTEELKFQLREAMEQLARPMNEKINFGPVFDMVDTHKIHDLRNKPVREDLARFNESAERFVNMDHNHINNLAQKNLK